MTPDRLFLTEYQRFFDTLYIALSDLCSLSRVGKAVKYSLKTFRSTREVGDHGALLQKPKRLAHRVVQV